MSCIVRTVPPIICLKPHTYDAWQMSNWKPLFGGRFYIEYGLGRYFDGDGDGDG